MLRLPGSCMTVQAERADRTTKARPQVRRAELFAGLFILGCANGLISQIRFAVHELGWLKAVFRLFDISAIVMVACVSGVALVARLAICEVRSADLSVAVASLALIVLPVPQLSWFAVALLSLNLIVSNTTDTSARRGAVILLATTVPMLWSRLLFHAFGNLILNIDARLVASILGTQRTGNMVGFADHSGDLVILPACSSLANMSLAFLCWVAVSQMVGHKWRPQDIIWCSLACASVIAINVSRLSLMALNQAYYNTIHSEWGDQITGLLMLAIIVGISALGTRREVFARA
jgi:exosortase/archaeosortase family protein